jgi:xanthine dehydrogenase iron-sulfur cluster and FAD-binding subunit A
MRKRGLRLLYGLSGSGGKCCLVLAAQANGQEIKTIRGLGAPNRPHPLQVNFIKYGAIQCGFCTPGMILSAQALLNKNPSPTRNEVREGISGNLCRYGVKTLSMPLTTAKELGRLQKESTFSWILCKNPRRGNLYSYQTQLQ